MCQTNCCTGISYAVRAIIRLCILIYCYEFGRVNKKGKWKILLLFI